MHLGMSYTELQKLPVRYRHWYVKRLSKHFEQKKDTINKSSNDQNAPLTKIEDFFKKKLE